MARLVIRRWTEMVGKPQFPQNPIRDTWTDARELRKGAFRRGPKGSTIGRRKRATKPGKLTARRRRRQTEILPRNNLRVSVGRLVTYDSLTYG